jgi:signal transduction histidine kinase
MTPGTIRFRLFILMGALTSMTLALACASYETFKTYQLGRQQLEASHFLSEAISTERNSRRLHRRHDVSLKNEAEFRRYIRGQLTYLENKLLYLGSLTIITLLSGLAGLQIFMGFTVIRPLKDLSRKMTDFMCDRYTYRFSVPGSDEIGHMHATFNALAQRVITNMDELRTLDQAKSEFLNIASHELRTPLTSIKGSLSLMRSGVVGEVNEMTGNLLTIAETETDRLIRLINDFLDLAKIEAQKLSLRQDWRSLNDVINGCLKSLQGLAQQAEVRLLTEALPPLEARIDGDRIQQILTNLVANAVKVSPKGKSVTIRANVDEGHRLAIEVRDQGCGIAPQDQEVIFQKFRQATTSPLVKGTGLGLAIAKALVEQHGGEIGVRSVPGDGSVFFFTLPEWRYGSQKPTEAAA